MVQLSSVSDHEVRAAQGWDGEVQTASKKETKQRHTDLGLPQGKLRSNLHEVTERENDCCHYHKLYPELFTPQCSFALSNVLQRCQEQ